MKSIRMIRVFSLVLALLMLASVSIYGVEYANGDTGGAEVMSDVADSDMRKVIQLANSNSELAITKGETIEDYSDEYLEISMHGKPYWVIRISSMGIAVDLDVIEDADKDDLAIVLQAFCNALESGVEDVDAKADLMSDLQKLDNTLAAALLTMVFANTKGNMYFAYNFFKPFLAVFNVLLGIGAVVLIIILLLSTVLDLAYIGLPVWREAQQDGNKGFLISYEAKYVVREAEAGIDGDYVNPYILYFKERALTYIVLAICIMYLICGGLSGIIGWVLSLVTGITG